MIRMYRGNNTNKLGDKMTTERKILDKMHKEIQDGVNASLANAGEVILDSTPEFTDEELARSKMLRVADDILGGTHFPIPKGCNTRMGHSWESCMHRIIVLWEGELPDATELMARYKNAKFEIEPNRIEMTEDFGTKAGK